MIARLLTATLLSGALAGVVMSAVQLFTTTPLIFEAESYESAAAVHEAVLAWSDEDVRAGVWPVHAGESHAEGEAPAWAPADGAERLFFTVMTNVIAGVAYGALLMAAFHMRGAAMDARRGLMWGVAGFVVFTVAPSLGLPPEAPGAVSAEVGAQQFWWLVTTICTAAGLWLLLAWRELPFNLLGVGLLILPHAIGAPVPDAAGGGALPPEIAARFVTAAIAANLVFWSVLGWTGGWSYGRFVRRPAPAGA